MSQSTKSANRRKAHAQLKLPEGFPLSVHTHTGRFYKVVRQRRHYFGKLSDGWQAALNRWLDVRDDLLAGRTPRVTGDGLTVRDLANRFLTAKHHQLDCGELSNRSFLDYKLTTDRLIAVFGRNRLVDDIASDDFEQLRADIAKTRHAVALGNEIGRVKVVFGYAFEASLVEKPIRYGPTFKRPSKKVLRQHRNKIAKRMFEADELRQLIEAAGPQMKAMILMAANCAFGNNDCGTLPISAIDFDNGWVDFPRPKTGIQRRCPLWPETVKALKTAIAERPEPKDGKDAELVFVTKYGQSWSKVTSTNPVSAQFRKLCQSTGLYRKGCGFYAIRHSFRTVSDETRDFPALDLLMGHSDASMADRYRERISDERLIAVVQHVREWLYTKGGDDE